MAFPEIILNSQTTEKYWSTLEKYFPHTQLFMVNEDNNLIGFMNIVPVFWDQPLKELPDKGWDWLVQRSIYDYENNIQPNSLGGLQIVITKKFQRKGFSKLLISKAKEIKQNLGLINFVIPIRPVFKHKFPKMKMVDYLEFKKDQNIYDPWIRTHLNAGAKIISVCKNSMNVKGDIVFWQGLLNKKIVESGSYKIKGALNLVTIDIEKDFGEYREENIWIAY
nr:GNAT family N-acetyltransferase [Aquimarina sp. 2201CG14-23]